MTFLMGFVNAWIFYVIKKTKVKAFCITWDLFRCDNLLKMTTLKTFFLSNSSINFCSNAESEKSVYLFCFRYISGFLWLYSANKNNTKSINKGTCIITTIIEKIYTKDACIGNAWSMGTYIGYASIRSTYTSNIYTKNAFVRGVGPKILVGSEAILISPRTNDYCLILSIKLILTLANSTSCCSISIWAILIIYVYLKCSSLAYKK